MGFDSMGNSFEMLNKLRNKLSDKVWGSNLAWHQEWDRETKHLCHQSTHPSFATVTHKSAQITSGISLIIILLYCTPTTPVLLKWLQRGRGVVGTRLRA